MERGTVSNITDRRVGTTVVEQTGSTVLIVSDIDNLDSEGGQVDVNGTITTYTVADPDLGEIHTGDTVSAVEDDAVLVYPHRTERLCWFRDVYDPDGEELVARVPHALHDRLPIGIREEGEVIEYRRDGEGLVVADVIAVEPTIDGSFIDPDTLDIPEPQITDGNPPDSSPTPVVRSGLGSLIVSWDATTNADPVTYEVHVSASTGFTPGPTTKVAELDGTLIFVRHLESGTALSPDTDYFVKLIAKDADGAAAPGAQASGQIAYVTGDDIAADTVTAVNILADLAYFEQLRAVLLIVNTLKTADSGQRMELDIEGLRSYHPDDSPSFTLDAGTGNVRLHGLVDFGHGSRLTSDDSMELRRWETTGFQEPALEQSAFNVRIGSGDLALGLNVPSANGNLLLVTIACPVALTIATPSGWASVATVAGSTHRVALFRRTTSTSSTGQTFALSGSSSDAAIGQIFEYSGLDIVAADRTATNTGSTSTASSGTTTTTTQTHQLALGVFGGGNDIPLFRNPNNSYLLLRQDRFPSGLGAGPIRIGSFVKHLTATGTQSVSVDYAATPWAALIATFKAREMGVSTTPPAPEAGKVRLYAKDYAGHTRLQTIDSNARVRTISGVKTTTLLTPTTSDPTTTSTADPMTAVIPQMTITADFDAEIILLSFSGTFTHSTSPAAVNIALYDGSIELTRRSNSIVVSGQQVTVAISDFAYPILTPGSKTFSVRWRTNTGTLTAQGLNRNFTVLRDAST